MPRAQRNRLPNFPDASVPANKFAVLRAGTVAALSTDWKIMEGEENKGRGGGKSTSVGRGRAHPRKSSTDLGAEPPRKSQGYCRPTGTEDNEVYGEFE